MNRVAQDFDHDDHIQDSEEHKANQLLIHERILDKLDSLTDDQIADAYISNYDLDPIDNDQMWQKLRDDILNDKNVVI